MVSLKRNGYTLLEMLLVLLIIITICSLIPLVFSILEKWIEKPSSLHPFEWEVATAQLGFDIREANIIRIEGERLVLVDINGYETSYESYQNNVRRRVNGTGHEIILQNIRTARYHYIDSGIMVTVEDLDGTEYTVKLFRWNEVVNSE
ncbi:competence type IV pilus minor pilin ComGF [Bacillus sp. AK128]